MKAIILAAGEGKRMRPLTLETPKPMLQVLGKPILEWIIDSLPAEITEIIFVVGYKKEVIQKYFGSKFAGRKIQYIVQDKQLGTGHALELCKSLIPRGERFLFMIGDDLHSASAIQKLLQHPFGMLVHEHKNPERFGVVEIDSKNRVIKFEEKPKQPKSNLVSPAVFVLDDRIFNYPKVLHSSGEFFAVDQINQMMREVPLVAERSDFWHPIGYPEDIDKAEKILAKSTKLHATPIIFLAGGKGTRMPENEKHLPKVLVDVAGVPMLAHQIANARRQGFYNIRLSLGYKADIIIDWLKANGETQIKYFVETEPLGTGGGIKLAAQGITQPFIALNSDNLADFNFTAMLRHSANGKYTVLSAVELEDARDFGLLECDEHKKICVFKEKDPRAKTGLISAGCYVLRPKDLDSMPEVFSIEKDLFPKLAAKGELVLQKHSGNYWFDCGTPERLEAVRAYFAKNQS